MTYQELKRTRPEDFEEAIIQDLAWHKLTLRSWRRNFRIAIFSMTIAVLVSISICVWTISNIKKEYSTQIEILRGVIEENALYKKGLGFEVKQELPGGNSAEIPLFFDSNSYDRITIGSKSHWYKPTF